MFSKYVLMSLCFLSLSSVTAAWSSESDIPSSCPATTGLTDQNCSLPYTGIGFIAGIFTLNTQYLKVAGALDEASSKSEDPACVPTVAKLTKQIRGGLFHKGCRKADIRDVEEILNQGNESKEFCRRTNTDAGSISYDLFEMKRLRDYVTAKLRESNPELCK